MFNITYPKSGQGIKLLRNKFIALGRAASGTYPLGGVLEGRTTKTTIEGRTLLEPRQGRSNWAILFDVSEIPREAPDDFTLTVFQVDGQNGSRLPLGNSATSFRLGGLTLQGVEILSVFADTSYCPTGFTPQGLLTDSDTQLVSVELLESGTSNPPVLPLDKGCDPDGFWWAWFDDLPDSSTRTYTLEVHGNASSNYVTGLKFQLGAC